MKGCNMFRKFIDWIKRRKSKPSKPIPPKLKYTSHTPVLSRTEIQRRATRKSGSTITDIGKHMKGKGSKHQLKDYRRSVKAKKQPEDEDN